MTAIRQVCGPVTLQRAYPTQAQKQALKYLISLQQILKEPEYPGAVRGLEGMKVADEILRERRISGVLIGGLAEEVWNRRRKSDDLAKHKDVDVAVLDDYSGIADFEGGLDWWMPYSGSLTVRYEATEASGIQKRWYENANGVVLSFGMEKTRHLFPGLYIPDSEWVISMRCYEAMAQADGRQDLQFDDEVFDMFEKQIRKRVKTRLPNFLEREFTGYILSHHYVNETGEGLSQAVGLQEFNRPTIVAINRFRGRYAETERPEVREVAEA